MSAELLHRAAAQLRQLADLRTPSTGWTYGQVDPRPNFGLFHGAEQVAELNWGSESPQLPHLLEVLLCSADPLAAWLDEQATAITDYADVVGLTRDGDLTETDEAAIAVARAILREG